VRLCAAEDRPEEKAEAKNRTHYHNDPQNVSACDKKFRVRRGSALKSSAAVQMKHKTEEFLYFLIWTCEMLTRPTFRNLTGSFEGWLYRNGLDRQIDRLVQRKYIESKSRRNGSAPAERLIRLTSSGHLYALGGRDPEACWNRPWDGGWRLVVFDIPASHRIVRDRLRRQLRGRGFGYVQKRVWISPDPIHKQKALLASIPVDIHSLLFWEGRPAAGETDREIVAGAWAFPKINGAYAKHSHVLAACPSCNLRSDTSMRAFGRWCSAERAAWLEAMALDPLLPAPLLPPDYRGRQAWKQRVEIMRRAMEKIRTFRVADCA